ncbi:MAG TPA: DUF4129 domain-containing protein [Pyrinomonadaceae bacterium]|nr:DUF4129 domain-containing protein [Pyrinomonadaceae bacterium]
MLCFFQFSVQAATLDEYEEKIHSAQISLAELLSHELETDTKEYAEFEREKLAEIRNSLPAQETIEWQGASVETGNQWLLEKLDAFEKEAKDSVKREQILYEISERLDAIEQKLTELENAAESERTKDEDKRKLSEILRREEYQKPGDKEESLFQRLYREFLDWLIQMFPRPNVPEGAASGFGSFSFVLQILLYALILGIIGFLIFKFAPFFAQKFRGREKKEKKERVILGEKLAADEDAQSLFTEAERLAREGNLRQAIRKGYVALLCELSDRKIIGLAQHKTNRDYLRDVRKRRELYENMSGLTNNFERHWYGFDEANEKDWEEFRNGYKGIVGSWQRQ